MNNEYLINATNLSVRFPIGQSFLKRNQQYVRSVDAVSIKIRRASFFGLVGESGSGKTTLGRALLHAVPIADGKIIYDDDEVQYDLAQITSSELQDYRKRAQLIFQDPYAALSPRMTVRDIIAEPLEVMGITNTRDETDEAVRMIASKCRLNLEHLRRYPHAFSGGQRQRISIARALVSSPRFVVADESVAALDVSIQADILNLLHELQAELGLTFMFISHDLSVVSHVCDDVAVMYLGRIVEQAPTRTLFAGPRHPYTRALLEAIPSIDPTHLPPEPLIGEIPSPINPPTGCTFHTRCKHATDLCKQTAPIMANTQTGSPDHWAACHHLDKLT